MSRQIARVVKKWTRRGQGTEYYIKLSTGLELQVSLRVYEDYQVGDQYPRLVTSLAGSVGELNAERRKGRRAREAREREVKFHQRLVGFIMVVLVLAIVVVLIVN